MQQHLQQRQSSIRLTVQVAIIPNPPKPLGQDLHHDAPQEVAQRQGPQTRLPGFAVDIAEGDGIASLVKTDQVALINDAAIQVTRQILECGQYLANVLTLHIPTRGLSGAVSCSALIAPVMRGLNTLASSLPLKR